MQAYEFRSDPTGPGRDAALHKFCFLSSVIAELLDDVRVDPRTLALQGLEPRQRYQPLVVEFLNSRQFTSCLVLDATWASKPDLFAGLRDLALKEADLASPCSGTGLEQRILRCE
jgi:hypothetical protein